MNNIKIYFFLLLFHLVVMPNVAQEANFNEQSFFQSLKDSYYTLKSTELKNFTVLVTNSKIEIFAEENWNNKEIFPLQVIWFNPDKIYISQLGVPALDSLKQAEFDELIEGLTKQVRGIMIDLQRFYFMGVYESIPEDYILKYDEEKVQITNNVGTGKDLTKVKQLLGHNGLLIQIEISYPAQNKRVYLFPVFKIVKTKWLCEGWKFQTYINNEVQNGFDLQIKNLFSQNVWVPVEISLQVQTAEEKGVTFYDIIKLKNYLFNQPIELLKDNIK
ncbi:MAG: hypothetical protein JXR46_15440 [Calditrichaceae bacterium]|nr:hypothetical protein [Calditrichaceae bacterium]MBN2710437.1 hypothetical protein [Calditrichaceae bacterium]RQV93626.1 MAG: hypothetical protein EH224_12195 [Calditrichota bacterium]